MVRVSEPNISVSKKTNEQNIAAIKSSLGEMVDVINILSSNIETLNAKVAKLESEE